MSIAQALILAIMMAACGGVDEPVGPEPEPSPEPEPTDTKAPIVFSGKTAETQAVTRAALNDGDGPTSFRVWAYKNDGYDAATEAYTSYQTVIDGYNVVFENGRGTTGWEYTGHGTAGREQTVKYWDYSARAYRYLAYAPADAAGASVTVSGTPATARMTVNVDANNADAVPYVSELWFSTGNAALYPDRQFGRTVQLRFVKPLARVRFMFTFAASVTYYGREALTGITFAPLDGSQIAFKGTVNMRYPINGTQTTADFSSSVAGGATYPDVAPALTVDYTDSTPQWYTVLPMAGQGVYRLTVSVLGEVRTADVPAAMMQWKPGYEYTYVFKVTENGGIILDLLQMAIHDWSEGTPRNLNFYNW